MDTATILGVGDVGRPGPVSGTTVPNPAPVSSPLFSSVLAVHLSAQVDVRNPDEYIGEMGHIAGSLLIPVAQLPHRLSELQNYRKHQVICICKAGGRSHTAAGILMQAGFPSVVSVAGGMTRWNELKYPATK